jgi:hypothetical protein
MRRGVTPELPPGHDARAVRLLASADRLAAVLDLARADAPAARSPAPRPAPATTRSVHSRRPSAGARQAAYNAVPSRHR